MNKILALLLLTIVLLGQTSLASPAPQLFGAGINYGSSSGGYQQGGAYSQGYGGGYNNGFGVGPALGFGNGLGGYGGGLGGFGGGLGGFGANSYGSGYQNSAGYQQSGAGYHSTGLQAGFGIGRR